MQSQMRMQMQWLRPSAFRENPVSDSYEPRAAQRRHHAGPSLLVLIDQSQELRLVAFYVLLSDVTEFLRAERRQVGIPDTVHCLPALLPGTFAPIFKLALNKSFEG